MDASSRDYPVIRYKSPAYTESALLVLRTLHCNPFSELYDFLEPQSHIAEGGECSSVGLVDGYIFAGGHAPISSKLGFTSDGILEIESTFANGSSFTASPSQNHNLY